MTTLESGQMQGTRRRLATRIVLRANCVGSISWRLFAVVLAIVVLSNAGSVKAGTLPTPSAWVVNAGDNSVSVIPLDSPAATVSIPVGDNPGFIALSPDQSRAYVSNRGSNTVSAIDITSGTILATIPVGAGPGRLSVSPDGQRVYVPNSNDNSVSIISTSSNVVVDTFPTPDVPSVVVHHPTRAEIWVGSTGFPSVSVFAEDGHTLIAGTNTDRYYGSMDLAFRAGGELALSAEACGLCGRFHYLSGVLSGDTVPVLDRDMLFDNKGWALAVEINPTSEVAYLAKLGQQGPHRVVEFGGAGRSLELSAAPQGIAVSPDGTRLFVAQNANPGSVVMIDTANMTAIGSLPAGAFPQDVAIVTGSAAPRSPPVNIAVNPARVGFPSPLESDTGWAGGADQWDLVDGLRSYTHWANGLAFTGGHQMGAGSPGWLEPAGVRQATIDFGEPRTFDRAVIWHHGDVHTPADPTLAYWNGDEWIAISFERDYVAERWVGANSGDSESDEYSFAPVTGSKFRYEFDNSGLNVLGEPNVHGWIYEVEIFSSTPQLIGDLNLDGYVNSADVARFVQYLGLAAGSTPSTGDLNGDGATDLVDLMLLRAHFGESGNASDFQPGPSPTHSVPEPTGIVLILAAVLCGVPLPVCRRARQIVKDRI